MSECTHDCSTCSENCSEKQSKEDFIEKTNDFSNVKKVIGVVSGKGGVGKSLVTSLLSVLMQRKGYKTAILDADITGPSIPKMFGITERAKGSEIGIIPEESKLGTKIMSTNLLLENDTDPVVWRGPVIAGAVKQFWTETVWGDVDYMFVDMPPGTGDVPLTVFQSIPVDAIVVVTTPQTLVSMIVKKAVKMANLLDIPIIGIVENMSYFVCPDCNSCHHIFGDSDILSVAKDTGIEISCEIPIDNRLANSSDKGMIELFEGNWLDSLADKIEAEL